MNGFMNQMFYNPYAGLLGTEEDARLQQAARQQGLLNIAASLLQAGGPSYQPQGLGAALGRGVLSGQQAAQDVYLGGVRGEMMRQEVEEKRKERQQREQASERVNQLLFGTTPQQALEIGGAGPTKEAAAMIGQGGMMAGGIDQQTLLRVATDPLMPKDLSDRLFKYAEQTRPEPVKLNENTALYAQQLYGTTDVSRMNPQQAADVLAFSTKPSLEQQISLARFRFETGMTLPQGQLPGVPQTVPQAAPVPQVALAAQAPSVQMPSVPKETSGKPLGKNEVPLIQSQALSPKQKQDLELKRPETVGVVEYAIDQTRQMANTARRLLANPNLERAFGIVGMAESKIPGTPAANILAELDVLRNQSFVQGLQAMRAASPTGGAVGNVSNAEGLRFENLQAALGQIQSGSQARKELERLVKELEGSEDRLKKAFERTYGKGTEFQVRPIFEPPPKPTKRKRGSTIRQDDEDLIRKHLPR